MRLPRNTDMNFLIFEYRYEGHYTEYLRHLLNYALETMPGDKVHCILSEKFKKHFNNGTLPTSNNFIISYLSPSDLSSSQATSGTLQPDMKLARHIAQYIRHNSIDKTIFITSSNLLLKVAIQTGTATYLSAIQYIIPRHMENLRKCGDSIWHRCKLRAHRCIDFLKMQLFALTPQVKALYLLNDEDSVEHYNRLFHTVKFRFLPDPIDCLTSAPADDNNKHNKITLLHAGKFHKGKGTFDIIEALMSIAPDQRERFRFILCGRSEIESDNTRAASMMTKLGELMDVEFYNDFVEEEFLHNLYRRADYILVPYHAYWASSGNLGHAASYHKPVIGPERGLLGTLIRKFHLGYTVKELSATGIADTLTSLLSGPQEDYGFDKYTSRCSPTDFARILFTL